MIRLSPVQALAATLISVAVATSLGEIYHYAATIVAPDWLAAAAVNSALALAALTLLRLNTRGLLSAGTRIAYVPALAVVVGSMALAKLTGRDQAVALSTAEIWSFAGSILWIPVIEELVFRGGVSQMFKAKLSPLWSAWFSAVIFTMVHGAPTLERLMSGNVGFALGAFLLALCCEALVYFSHSLLPAIAFHAACNATVMIFGILSPQWLAWLGPLYLK
ncbi:MAG: CPBP family intramembrane metalloprotease [Deltaproteobacteria bacterium]|nr:CPBP family intramembrane metalloprotease [Deltaproteobacteria bacterium]